jgi:hypothetical protein
MQKSNDRGMMSKSNIFACLPTSEMALSQRLYQTDPKCLCFYQNESFILCIWRLEKQRKVPFREEEDIRLLWSLWVIESQLPTAVICKIWASIGTKEKRIGR